MLSEKILYSVYFGGIALFVIKIKSEAGGLKWLKENLKPNQGEYWI